MTEMNNPTCSSCDYVEACHKRILRDGADPVYVKNQRDYIPECLCKVQDICKDCQLFAARRCAAWQTLNGKLKTRGAMTSCPKKIPRGK
jgi:hypothetical protein